MACRLMQGSEVGEWQAGLTIERLLLTRQAILVLAPIAFKAE